MIDQQLKFQAEIIRRFFTQHHAVDENFKIINLPFRPTAENLAKYIYEALSKNYLVDCLDVYETPNNCASYRGKL